MNSYLISSYFKIWLFVEKIDDTNFRMLCVNQNKKQVRIPQNIKIYNDNQGRFMEEDMQQFFTLNNTDNHSIYFNDMHILDFSHSRLWEVI